jgi:serine protease Do
LAKPDTTLRRDITPGPVAQLVEAVEPATVIVFKYGPFGTPLAQGSGFFVSGSGEFVTCRHCVEGADAVSIETREGNAYQVTTVLADDHIGDMVRLGTNVTVSVPSLKLCSSGPLKGEDVVVLGTPRGHAWSVSKGIVAAFRPNDQIQVDAAISHGSSGSPVFNMKGEVIGVITSTDESGQNLNFASSPLRLGRFALGTPEPFDAWKSR